MTRTIVLLSALVVAGCGPSDPCANDPALCQDAGQGTCTGQCLPAANGGLYALIWSGPEGATPPACPSVANIHQETGYLDTPPSVTCSPCTCSPSENVCSPSGTMSANAAACPATGASVQPFNAPPVWDGTCNAMDPVSSAASLTVDPPSLGFVPVQGQCSPSGSEVMQSSGATIALRCNSLGTPGTCPSQDQVCTYPNVPGFSICVFVYNDLACPEGLPTRRLLFEMPTACICACGAPAGESCSATVTAYEDGACSNPLGSVTVTSDQPAACLDVNAGAPLGSKSALVSYHPGTCAPTVQTTQAETVCCMP